MRRKNFNLASIATWSFQGESRPHRIVNATLAHLLLLESENNQTKMPNVNGLPYQFFERQMNWVLIYNASITIAIGIVVVIDPTWHKSVT
jgi:hypothetical protein